MARAADIVRHHDSDPLENPWVDGQPPPERIEVHDYDPRWPELYRQLARRIGDALGGLALEIAHVGSTAVPGLAAKPVIDIDLTVADPRQEQTYVPALEQLGYRLRIREPSWHQHRCLQLESPRVNLHVFGPDCPETIRHRLFRDWLRENAEDRESYAAAKRASADGEQRVADYNRRKEPLIRAIYARAFAAAGLI
ncbi:TPA: GrpB family protein [Pseudomonas aeruginosa]|nr:GrpB family protein [Pseudomonas aeruginosa]